MLLACASSLLLAVVAVPLAGVPPVLQELDSTFVMHSQPDSDSTVDTTPSVGPSLASVPPVANTLAGAIVAGAAPTAAATAPAAAPSVPVVAGAVPAAAEVVPAAAPAAASSVPAAAEAVPAVAGAVPAAQGHFIIFGLARCGSEWLISMLNKHQSVGVGVMEPLDSGQTPPDRIGETLSGLLKGLLPNGKMLPKAEQKSMLGFKYFNKQGYDIAFDPANALPFQQYLQENHFKAIFLRRNSSIAREVSLERMRVDGQVTKCTDEACLAQIASAKVSLDVSNLARELKYADSTWAGMLRWVNGVFSPADLRLVDYETLQASPQAEVQDIFRFLGLSVPDASEINPSQTLKMSTGAVADMIDNLDEVRAAVAGTQWATEIDPPSRT